MKYPAAVNMDGGDLGVPDASTLADVGQIRDAARQAAAELLSRGAILPDARYRAVFGIKIGKLSAAGEVVRFPKDHQVAVLKEIESVLPPGVVVYSSPGSASDPEWERWLHPLYAASGGMASASIFYLIREPA